MSVQRAFIASIPELCFMKLVLIILATSAIFGISAFTSPNRTQAQNHRAPKSGNTVDDTLVLNDLIFANFFSPNGDGHNDQYIILNVENYPENTFKVINRWGETVFYASPYQNNWDGTCTVNGPLFDKNLPEGTYYFHFTDGLGLRATGKLTLKR